MSTAELPEEPSEDQILAVESETSPSQLDQTEIVDDGSPRCEKCGAPIKTTDMLACRSCGWYASIGSYVEIDQNWENQCDPNADDSGTTEAEEFKLPPWAIVLGASVLGVVALSIAFHLVTPTVSAARTNWSLAQLSAGLLAFAVCHLISFSKLMSAKAETNMIDMIVSPQKCWVQLAETLPEGQWLAHGAASGLTAVAMSLLVIGGIRYEKLWDWGFEKPPEKNLMSAVLSQAQQIEGDENGLEDAVEEFAGMQDLENLDDELVEEPPVEEVRLDTDGVVLGYRTDEEGMVSALLIGVEHDGALVYAGRVFPELPEDELEDLTETLGNLKSNVPFVNTDQTGVIWVVPRQVCLISYKRQGAKGWLYEAKFERLRGLMDLSK